MVYLGTKKPLTKTKSLNYIHISNPNILNMKIDDSVTLDADVISSIQVILILLMVTLIETSLF